MRWPECHPALWGRALGTWCHSTGTTMFTRNVSGCLFSSLYPCSRWWSTHPDCILCSSHPLFSTAGSQLMGQCFKCTSVFCCWIYLCSVTLFYIYFSCIISNATLSGLMWEDMSRFHWWTSKICAKVINKNIKWHWAQEWSSRKFISNCFPASCCGLVLCWLIFPSNQMFVHITRLLVILTFSVSASGSPYQTPCWIPGKWDWPLFLCLIHFIRFYFPMIRKLLG